MGGRRKRLKPGNSNSGRRSCSIAEEFEQGSPQITGSGSQEMSSGFSVDTSMFESGSFASRSSVRLIHEVISNFDNEKRELVKSTGFGGLLSFPPVKQFNRKFSLWLMSCVDHESMSINVGDHIRIPFNKFDVGLVFGIPTSGKNVVDVLADSRNARDRVIRDYLGPNFKEQRSIKIAQHIVERQYGSPLVKSDADKFRIAFVVFVVSNLLAPSAKYDYACIDYWNAIQDADNISSYDWGEYVVNRLLEGVSKLKQDISNNLKFPNISGCSFFLQVLYLDSLQLDGLSYPHNSFPRVRHFSFEVLRAMISADKNYARHMEANNELPLRIQSDCSYSWAIQASSVGDEATGGCLFAIWEVVVAMVHLLNIPLEAAGPLFTAAADFQNQINSGMEVTGIQVIKFMSLLVSLMTPYSRGFRYQYSYARTGSKQEFSAMDSAVSNGIRLMAAPLRCHNRRYYGSVIKPVVASNNYDCGVVVNRACSIVVPWAEKNGRMLQLVSSGDQYQPLFNSVSSRFDGTPYYLNVNFRVVAAMSQFYSLMRKFKHANGFDLNEAAGGSVNSPSLSSVSCGSECDYAPSPWELGYLWSLDDVTDGVDLLKLGEMGHDESLAIVHRSPKYIQVASCDLRAQFLGHCEMEGDMFDALIKVLRQEDDALYSSFGHLRRRYFFESDFMESILSGSLDLLDSNLADHLCITNSTLDVCKCKIVFFPILLQFHWACFAWQPGANVIYVFAPGCGLPPAESRVEAIGRSCYLLKVALNTLSRSVFAGLSYDVGLAEMRIVSLVECMQPRFNRSGVLCSFFCRCFDGVDLTPHTAKVDEEVVAAKLLFEIMNLKENEGTLITRI